MHVRLTIEDGPAAGTSCVVESGQALDVGRGDTAGWVLREDSLISNRHFSVRVVGDECFVRDLGSRFGTSINGGAVTESVVRPGDVIKAGNTTFSVKVLDAAAVAPAAVAGESTPAVPAAAVDAVNGERVAGQGKGVLDIVRAQSGSLFAILDAAREPPQVLERVRACGLPCATLYEGPQAETIEDFGPFLIEAPKDSPFLESLLADGWGRSWGVLLTSKASFAEVRKQLRRFLIVQSPEGKRLYFRYYDPRVLRVFLPTCTPEEATDFFGPIEHFLLEGDEPTTLLRFSAAGGGLKADSVPV